MHVRITILSLALVQLIGCGPAVLAGPTNGVDSSAVSGSSGPDNDGDGWGETLDCNDGDATVHPGATEVCGDGIDNDCDGSVDGRDNDADLIDFMYDGDQDGYGDDYDGDGAVDVVHYCEPSEAATVAGQTGGNPALVANYEEVVYVPDGMSWVLPPADCDDSNVNTFPGAIEYCDGLDNDCDASTPIDEASLMGTWYADIDGDTYGNASDFTTSCDASEGWVADDTDCDDLDPMVNPGAAEVCDDVDNDCNVDTTEPTSTFYADADGDMYGDAGMSAEACESSEGWIADGTDCNDLDPMVNPGAAEVCDTVDNDCNPETTESALTFYADADGDGFGDAAVSQEACDASEGWVANDSDCEDLDPMVNPGADETCANDGLDNDCDGSSSDTPIDQTTWYADTDSDGFGDETDPGFMSCTMPVATFPFQNQAGDCNDANGAVNPDAAEVLNGFDDNCDDVIDDVTSCTVDIYVLSGSGEATSITGVVSDDAALSGDWISGVSGVSVTPYSLGGDAWEYRFTMGLCVSDPDGSILLDGGFEDGTSLADDALANLTGYQDGSSFHRAVYDNGDSTNSYRVSW